MMQTDIIYGMGFSVYGIDEGTILKFIYNHKNTFCDINRGKELFEEIISDESSSLEDILCDYECEMSGREGYYAAVSNIISKETGIRMQYEPGDEDENGEAIIFTKRLPWDYNEAERGICNEEFEAIMLPYLTELNLTADDISYMGIEYFG